MKKQRGQVIIEFALILPLFLLMIFGLIYSGMQRSPFGCQGSGDNTNCYRE